MAVFVGRDLEQGELQRALDGALDGRGGVVLLAGEPGIGKTSLCDQLAAVAEERGAVVRWGRCPEAMGAPPFWPWRQVLGGWPDEEPDADRFMVFEARTQALRDLAERSGLVAIFDDLHWADEGSLRLLVHAATSLRASRVLIIGTYRDVEVDPGGPLDESIAALARCGPVLAVRGLDEGAIAQLALAAGAAPLDPLAAARITGHTGGNPFFAEQVVRLLQSEGRAPVGDTPVGVPPGVGQVVRQRIARLGDETANTLAIAAVLGRSFDVQQLAAVTGSASVDKAVEVASAAGLLVPATRPGAFRFVHALVREALEEDLGPLGAARTHATILEVLSRPVDNRAGPAALAHHALGAAAVIGADAASGYVLDAAEAALEDNGYEEAIRLTERALAFDDLAPDRRYGLLLVLGRARFGADDPLSSELALIEAAELAERDGDGPRAARALLEIGSGRLISTSFDAVGRLRRALDLIADDDLALRADVLSRLGDLSQHPDDKVRLGREAIAVAEASGDATAYINAAGRFLLNCPAQMTMPERRDLVDKVVACARDDLPLDIRLNARAMELRVLLEEGALDLTIRAAVELSRQTAHLPFVLQFKESTEALVHLARGDLDKAAAEIQWLMAETQRRGAEYQLGATNNARMMAMLRERDQLPIIIGLLDAMRQQPVLMVDDVTLDLITAMIAAEQPDLDAALHAIDVALGHDLDLYSRNWGGNGAALCCLLADAALVSGHREAGARLLPLLARVADRNVVMGMPPPIVHGWGSYYVGICQLLTGDIDAAAASFEDALEHNTAMGALPFVGRTRLGLARVALARDDGAGALAHATAAKDIADRSGLAMVARHAETLLSALGAGEGGAVDTGTVTFVFTDIVGSTAGTAAAGDRAWREALDAHTSHLRALAVRHGGRVVKGLGDGYMLTFPSARAGVDFAIELQRESMGGFVLRVGVHTGEAEVVGDDYIGHHVNLAARVSGAAGDGEVLVSDVVHTILAGARDITWGEPRTATLKGIPDPQTLHPAS